jgi:hypothetical protein
LLGTLFDPVCLESTKLPAGAYNKLLMKNWFKNIAVAVALLSCSTIISNAQDAQNRRGGNGRFDPEEMRQRMAERMREQFAVTDDAEWKIIEGKIQKVNEARRAVGGGMGFGAMGGFGGRRGGEGDNNNGGQGGRRFGGEPSAEVEDLRKAIEAKATPDEIKAKLAKVREVRKANEAKLEAAQEDLRKILTVRQEAVAVMNGLLK